jgi:hypothetical protein
VHAFVVCGIEELVQYLLISASKKCLGLKWDAKVNYIKD